MTTALQQPPRAASAFAFCREEHALPSGSGMALARGDRLSHSIAQYSSSKERARNGTIHSEHGTWESQTLGASRAPDLGPIVIEPGKPSGQE